MKRNDLKELKKIYLDDGNFGDIIDNELSEKKLDEMTPLLGEIIMHFNYLESVLDDVVTDCIFERSSELGLTIIAKMSYSQKVELLKDLLVPFCNNNGRPKFGLIISTLIKGLLEAGEDRNRAIHARWFDADKEFFVRTKIGVDKEGVYGLFVKLDKKTLRRYLANIQKFSDMLSDDLYQEFINGQE